MRKIYAPVFGLFDRLRRLSLAKLIIVSILTLFVTSKASANYTIPAGTSINASTITGQTGTLIIYGTLYVDQNVVSLLGFTSVIINGPDGQIYWNGNYDLKFAAGITFDINNPTPGLQPTAGNGNASTRLYIGSTVIAVQSDNSNNAAFSFEDFNNAGGLPQFTISSSPASPATICYGSPFTATITPTDNIVYFDCVWSINNGGAISPSSSSNFNTAQTAVITPTASTSTKTYTITCTLYEASDIDPITSKTVTVTVNPTVMAIAGGSSTVCVNATTPAFTDATSGGTWSITNGTGTATITSGGIVTGITAGTVTVVYTYSGTCPGAATKALTINALPTVFSVTGGGNYCSGGSGVVIGLSGSESGVNYQLYNGASAVGSAVAGTGSSISFGNQTTVGTYTVVAINATTSCTKNMTGSAVVAVYALPTAFTVTGGGSYCSGGSGVAIGLSGSQSGINYQLYNGASTVGGIVAGTGSSISFGNQTASGTYTVVATNATTSCTKNMIGSATIAINSRPTSVIAPTAQSICNGNSANIGVTLTGTAPWTLTYFDGTTSTVVSGIATSSYTFSVSPGSFKTYTITALSDASCTSISADRTGSASVGLHNVWTGTTSSDWFTASNWSDGQLPDLSCSAVTIPQVASPNVYPVLSSGIATINNLVIDANATLTLSGGKIQIAGGITNSGTLDAINGAVEFNGAAAQTISANTFQNNALKNLTVSNAANTVNLAGPLNLYGTLSFTGTGKSLVTNDNLTLKSTVSQTANVDSIAVDGSGNALNFITGNVTVERFIPAKRAWRFLSVPTNTTQTFHEAWQENQPQNIVGISGYGTQITSNIPAWASSGFDNYSPDGPSLKMWNSAANSYTGLINTNTGIATTEGLVTFVRGDRTAVGLGAIPTATVLRTKGTLKMGDQPTIAVPSGKMISVGNPYASAIDMRTIAKMAGKNYTFYLYNPNINSLGGFQTFLLNADGNYYAVPGAATPHNYIESGQAFFVASDDGTITIKESSKAAGSGSLVFRSMQAEPSLRTNLYLVDSNGNAALADGVLNSFSEKFNNAVDGKDCRKMMNFSENLGIKNGDQILAVEKRHTISKEDTIFLNMTKMKAKSYQFQIAGENFNQSGLIAFLEDSYLNTTTPVDINGTTTINFNVVDAPGSWNPNRFRIVFRTAVALPVTFTSVNAYQQNKNIAVEWKVGNENSMKQYEVEKSIDGQHFTLVATVAAKVNNGGTANYQWLDANFSSGNNYYRIKSITIDGNTQYTSAVKVEIATGRSQITVFPNPVTDGNINLQLINQPKGKYEVNVVNNLGQVIMVKQIEHTEGSSTQTIQLSKTAAKGNYQLQIITPDNRMVNTKLLVR